MKDLVDIKIILTATMSFDWKSRRWFSSDKQLSKLYYAHVSFYTRLLCCTANYHSPVLLYPCSHLRSRLLPKLTLLQFLSVLKQHNVQQLQVIMGSWQSLTKVSMLFVEPCSHSMSVSPTNSFCSRRTVSKSE